MRPETRECIIQALGKRLSRASVTVRSHHMRHRVCAAAEHTRILVTSLLYATLSVPEEVDLCRYVALRVLSLPECGVLERLRQHCVLLVFQRDVPAATSRTHSRETFRRLKSADNYHLVTLLYVPRFRVLASRYIVSRNCHIFCDNCCA